jgi:hypothetical protein
MALTTAASSGTPVAPAVNRRDQIAFAVFSTWIIAGLFLDGWSHQANKPETFFTPWHGLMYSGFGASVLWSMWESRRTRAAGATGDGFDRLSIIGVVVFVVGGTGDLVWHSLLGIEAHVEALLSPTHLTLMTGGLLLAATPVRVDRASWNGVGRERAPWFVLQSVTACVAIVAFFTQFASVFRGRDIVELVALRGMGDAAETHAIQGAISVLLSNALLVGAIAYVVARWRTPRFAFTTMLGVVALGQSGQTGFAHLVLVLAAVAGGLAADTAVARGRSDLAPVVAPLVMWPAWTAALALTVPFGWSPNLWGGITFLAVLTGVGARLLVKPMFAEAAR